MLKAVICGMEHSGTTLLSDLLRQSGTLESGFECGVLMTDSPREFPELDPFYGFMEEGWSISKKDLVECCNTDSFDEFYKRLKAASAITPESMELFDKTPRYVAELTKVMQNTDAPILLIHKDPRAAVFSDYKRAGGKGFDKWFDKYSRGKRRYMRRCYAGYEAGKANPSRVHSIALEDLCFASRDTCEGIFKHIGLKFDLTYLLLENLRYKNTRAKFVSADIVLEYRKGFSKSDLKRIETDFAEFDDWFYD
ncbi:sulfotransferase family protein [Henriciella litoralis]|uniref:sulfotransferase family protein n=1 Tax=Henriciella litoralis TaxID=568102 RepID=UPI0009FEA042|nr:sulfotransferase [Henriciella litoralis]